MDRARAAHGQQLPHTTWAPEEKRGEGLWRKREWQWVSTLGSRQDWQQQTGYLGGA